jgi:hypothetical protein
MRIEQRQLLMAMRDVAGVVDVERDGARRVGVTGAIKIDEDAAKLHDFAQARRVLPTRQGRLRAQIIAGIGQAPAGKLERRILAQMIEVVRILIAAGDGQNARAKDTAECRVPSEWVISKGLRGSVTTAASFSASPNRRSACPNSITPASEVMRPPSNAAAIFLRRTAGNENESRLSSGIASM